MGTPLLVVGASAGRLLPRAGPWMETVKAIFGVLFLGVAAWMLDRLLGPRTMMFVWAAVAFSGAWVAWAVGLRGARRGGIRVAATVLVALHGTALVAAGALGGTNPVLPLSGLGVFGAKSRDLVLPFRQVHSVADLDRELATARAAGKRTMLDFYADWCVSCKEMDAHTFRDPAVQAALADYVLLKADVTANSADDQVLLRRFGIFGPPTTAFFAADGRERRDYRLVGFKPAEAFVPHLKAFEAQP
jgi:thiol:disulfide interchange protein DsbD